MDNLKHPGSRFNHSVFVEGLRAPLFGFHCNGPYLKTHRQLLLLLTDDDDYYSKTLPNVADRGFRQYPGGALTYGPNGRTLTTTS